MKEKLKISPWFQQYYDIKKDYQQCILFFQDGDFYEMYSDDAKSASKILGTTLASRSNIPVTGVPVYDAVKHITQLVSAGKQVAICNQVGVANPRLLMTKFERKVVKVVSPRKTALERLIAPLAALLDKHNYLKLPLTQHCGLGSSINK